MAIRRLHRRGSKVVDRPGQLRKSSRGLHGCVLDGTRHGTEVAQEVSARVRAAHGIEHVTVQPESPTVRVSFQPLSGIVRPRK